jgi:hypothetical protein
VAANIGTTLNYWQEFDFGLPNVGEEPTLSECHLDSIVGLDTLHLPEKLMTNFEQASDLRRLERVNQDVSGDRNSWLGEEGFTTRWPAFDEPASATTTSSEPSSLRSSYHSEDCDTPVSIYSPSQSPRNSQRGSVYFDKALASAKSQQGTRPRHISLVGSDSLNAGCYRPSGLPGQSTFAPALSKFASCQTMTTFGAPSSVTGRSERLDSAASSVYEMDNQEADDRDADTVRGRRRTRVSVGLAGFAFDE